MSLYLNKKNQSIRSIKRILNRYNPAGLNSDNFISSTKINMSLKKINSLILCTDFQELEVPKNFVIENFSWNDDFTDCLSVNFYICSNQGSDSKIVEIDDYLFEEKEIKFNIEKIMTRDEYLIYKLLNNGNNLIYPIDEYFLSKKMKVSELEKNTEFILQKSEELISFARCKKSA